MRKIFIITSALAAFAASTVSASASQTLTGTVTANYLEPDTGTSRGSSILTVGTPLSCTGSGGAGICNAFLEPATILASGDTISLTEGAGTSFNNTAFNGVDFSGLTFAGGATLTGFSLDTNLSGLTSSDISFTSNSIEFNASGLSFANAPYYVKLNLSTSSGAVPETATWAMMIVGMGAVGFAMRRRQTVAPRVSYTT